MMLRALASEGPSPAPSRHDKYIVGRIGDVKFVGERLSVPYTSVVQYAGTRYVRNTASGPRHPKVLLR